MKSDPVRNLMKRGFQPVSDIPQREVERACDRVLERLQAEPQRTPTVPVPSARSRVAPAPSPLGAANDRRGVRWAWTWSAAAAVIVFAVAAAIVWRPVDGVFRVAEGEVHNEGGVLRSNSAAGAVLLLSDGSRVEMRSQSELSLERADDGLRIRLVRGGIIVDAATQRTGHLYVQTKEVTVSVVGTVFLVNADERGSHVAVIEGEVHVQQGTSEKKLLPGEQVATSPTMTQSSIKEEVAWARNAPLLVGLLQQAIAPPETRAPQNPALVNSAFEAISIRPTTIPAGSAGRGGGGGGGGRRNQRGSNPCSLAGEPVVDPRRFEAVNGTVLQLVSWAYGLDCWMNRGPDLLFGGPEWIRKDGFDVQATIPEGSPVQTKQQLRSHEAPTLQRMLQRLLADRFSLVTHREMRELPVYVLTVAKGGPKFTRVNAPHRDVDRNGNPVTESFPTDGSKGPVYRLPPADQLIPEFSVWQEGDSRDLMMLGPSEIHGRKRTIAELVSSLWLFTGRPVLDRTGLSGYFNYFLQFAVVECPTCPFTAPGPDARREPGSGPPPTQSLFSVLEQVGLELKPSREQVEVLVIDRVEQPSEN